MSNDEHSTVDDWVHLPPAELTVSVAIAPAPEIALASLRPVVTPVRDVDGHLADWAIDASTVLERDPDAASIAEYRAWRSTWHREWPLGPISNVASLADETAAIEHDLDRHLDALLRRIVPADGGSATIESDLAEGLLRELETIRLALSVDDRRGTGLVDDMPLRSRSSGLARTWAPPLHEAVLSATPVTSVLIRPDDGLVLVHGVPGSATTFVGITAVDMRADPVVILNERGSSLRLRQSDARPLGWIVPRSLRWHLRAVPLVSVWTQLFDGLAWALRVSTERESVVEITAQASVSAPITETRDV